ncbi:U4/U6 small nuclear ribonucleoprotein Prp3-like [Patiria miniata]|uniref:U4/U6 small nuclear ribonucleoprotein Prp3 n=1 Tax=Patiria miniata TaxID=46514 RepID=A0A914A311_PATMI|nr:U4/U6 small nuclear ribonucleoprotein Prp3-like [Patiria miniata]
MAAPMGLSKRDLDDLRPTVDDIVRKVLGFSEPSVTIAALNCIGKGMTKLKTVDLLKPLIEESAPKFVEKLFEAIERSHSSRDEHKAKKRSIKDEDGIDLKPKKLKSRFDSSDISEEEPAVAEQWTPQQIKEMMATARLQIMAKRDQTPSKPQPQPQPRPPPPQAPPAPPPAAPTSQVLMNEALDKARRAAEIQSRIQASMATAGLGQLVLQQALAGVSMKQAERPQTGDKPPTPVSKPTPLILNEKGVTVDASGKEITLTQRVPTLKANIRAKRREEFKINQAEKPQDAVSEASKFFDSSIAQAPAQRTRRGFKFHDRGRFEQLAQRVRAKSQLEKLQSEIAQAAKKTGITSATKLALIAPKKELREGEIPDTEWWDTFILPRDSYRDCKRQEAGSSKGATEKYVGITNLVEHPIQMNPPAEMTTTVTMPIYLTKKERKKLRRQTRREIQKEQQEKVRLGLEPPPEPKVRMANLMRVLGNEAVQDPTKVEAHVRAQMAKRQRTHEEANATRKLTADQRKEKKIRKLKEDTSSGIHVSVYCIRDLSNPAKRFKIEANSNQLHMTGMAISHKDVNVVVVEGGPKQQGKFERLMMHRIKWGEDKKRGADIDSDDSDNESEPKVNKCALVWRGMVKQRCFSELKFKLCPTESMAREQFRKHGVEHYWALAHGQRILEATEDA